jgi:hypothetical protein
MSKDLKQRGRDLLYAVAPRAAAALMSARARKHSHRLIEQWGYARLNEKLIAHLGTRVVEGPFEGMTLTPLASAEHLGPFLLGIYESELDPAWDQIFRRDYVQILDIGAKFGYYAIGLARRYPGAVVTAFDPDRWARRATREMVSANGLRNVHVRSYCSRAWLARNVRSPALIVSDCEGYEADLFVPEVTPALGGATLLIETHDGARPGITDRLERLFAASHTVRVIGSDAEHRASTRPLEFLAPDERRLAVHEIRGPQMWLLCLPRDRHASESV